MNANANDQAANSSAHSFVRYSASKGSPLRNLIGLVAALSSFAAVASAQSTNSGTFEISGIASVLVNRQTITPQNLNDGSLPGDVDLTSANMGFEGTYYVTPRFGIGGLSTYQRFSLEAPDRNARFEISGGYFGPLVQLRLPLGDRSEFVLVGSDGGVTASLTNRNTGVSNNIKTHADGRYWLVGGGLSFFINPSSSFDLGVRYQSSTFTGQSSQRVTAAGLLLGIGFSLYLH